MNNETRLYRYNHYVAVIIGLGILLPVFFQIEGGIFRDSRMMFDSRGLINRLPIPISVVVCLLGIPFVGRYKNALSAIVVLSSSLYIDADFYIFYGRISREYKPG